MRAHLIAPAAALVLSGCTVRTPQLGQAVAQLPIGLFNTWIDPDRGAVNKASYAFRSPRTVSATIVLPAAEPGVCAVDQPAVAAGYPLRDAARHAAVDVASLIVLCHCVVQPHMTGDPTAMHSCAVPLRTISRAAIIAMRTLSAPMAG